MSATSDRPRVPASPPPPVELLDDEELAAWRGMLRVHAELTRALDAELTRAHALPLTSYEVLLFLASERPG